MIEITHKTQMLEELIPLVQEGSNYICITRPRRFGKTVMANMIASFFSKGNDSHELFDKLHIADSEEYETSINQHNVIYIRFNEMALMAAGIPVSAKVREYAATSMDLQTRDEIFSAMVVYGFLSYSNGFVTIPNKELMDKFDDMLRKEASLGYVNRLARESERMLRATLSGDTETMLEILEYAHNTEIPLMSYNNETDLTAVVNLLYLATRDSYRVEREDKAGIGYVDFIFYPEDKKADGIILELKVDHTPEEAIAQIKEKQYALRFQGKLI